jgi:hypothetical protein
MHVDDCLKRTAYDKPYLAEKLKIPAFEDSTIQDDANIGAACKH